VGVAVAVADAGNAMCGEKKAGMQEEPKGEKQSKSISSNSSNSSISSISSISSMHDDTVTKNTRELVHRENVPVEGTEGMASAVAELVSISSSLNSFSSSSSS